MGAIDPLLPDNIRFVTFNVNGVRTFFHYAPFSEMRQSLRSVFDWFESDVITFQELKTEPLSLNKWGKVDGFYSFISIPQKRKGYSGVGCWVRIPPRDSPKYNALQVLRAEEGITGYLEVKNGKQSVSYRDDSEIGIGGYIPDDSLPDHISTSDALQLDSEGRCVIVELKCGIVVISVYCPANSTCTDEGEVFRMRYLKLLFARIRNLQMMGKMVVLMGDLNICRDLIDHAVSLEEYHISIGNESTGTQIDEEYRDFAIKFIVNPEVPHRLLLNQILDDSMVPNTDNEFCLIDTTRKVQGRDRLKMYTVWNTLKNTRPSNFGSRIDFILVSKDLGNNIEKADILPDIIGSDHCPVFCDINLNNLTLTSNISVEEKIPKFEARYRYNMTNRNIFDMFAKKSGKSSSSIGNKLKSEPIKDKVSKPIHKRSAEAITDKMGTTPNQTPKDKIALFFQGSFGPPPLCKHKQHAILKTSKTSNNPGKKFWTCSKPRGHQNDENSSCGFFEWA